MPMDTEFAITIEGFGDGLSPLAHIDTKTFIGTKGQASEMKGDVISNPGFLQQSPALANLTNGNEAGVVDQLIRHILDHPTASDVTFGVGTSKLFKLSSTTVLSGGSPSWPQPVTVPMINSHVLDLESTSSQYASIADASQQGLDLGNTFTIEGKIKFESTPTTGNSMAIVAKWKDTTNDRSYALSLYNEGGTLKLRLQISNDGTAVPVDAKVAWTPTTGVWYHVAVTFNGPSLECKFYVNAVQQGTTQVVTNSTPYNNAIAFGIGTIDLGGTPRDFLDGKLNNMRVWNIVRTLDQITWGMSKVLTVATGLKGNWYSVNDHNDLSSYGNNLTATGSPVFDTDVPFASYNLNMTEGECVVRLKENLFVFYNRASDGEIAVMPLATEIIDPDWGSSTDQALEKALHPAATKEDIMLFGNGRYVGAYVQGAGTLDVRKLDFGEGAEVADIVYHRNLWWIAVNYAGRRGQIYLYDGSAQSNILADEAGLGLQKIGFLFVQNGIVYVAYDDLTADGFSIGWVSGSQIKPLRYFSGSLPDHRQKTLYKNTILFISSESVYSFGAPVEQLPIQISRLADAGYSTVGAIAAPFGTPMVASTDGASPTPHFRLAKFSGLAVDSLWKSIFFDLMKSSYIGKIGTIIVETKPLEAGARADITLEGNQGQKTSNVLQVTGTNKTRHVFRSINLPQVEDVRVLIDSQNGSATKPCPIRKVVLLGNFVEQ